MWTMAEAPDWGWTLSTRVRCASGAFPGHLAAGSLGGLSWWLDRWTRRRDSQQDMTQGVLERCAYEDGREEATEGRASQGPGHPDTRGKRDMGHV